jgi:hypothetical protein
VQRSTDVVKRTDGVHARLESAWQTRSLLQAISELAAGGEFTGENAIEISTKFDTNFPAAHCVANHLQVGRGLKGRPSRPARRREGQRHCNHPASIAKFAIDSMPYAASPARDHIACLNREGPAFGHGVAAIQGQIEEWVSSGVA